VLLKRRENRTTRERGRRAWIALGAA